MLSSWRKRLESPNGGFLAGSCQLALPPRAVSCEIPPTAAAFQLENTLSEDTQQSLEPFSTGRTKNSQNGVTGGPTIKFRKIKSAQSRKHCSSAVSTECHLHQHWTDHWAFSSSPHRSNTQVAAPSKLVAWSLFSTVA